MPPAREQKSMTARKTKKERGFWGIRESVLNLSIPDDKTRQNQVRLRKKTGAVAPPRRNLLSTLSDRRASGRALGAGRPPLAGRRSLPPVKRPEEGVRILISQQIRGLVQFERGFEQVVLRQFAPRFLHQVLEGDALRQQPPLQRPGADAQFHGHILQPRSLTRQKLLQDSLHLFF